MRTRTVGQGTVINVGMTDMEPLNMKINSEHPSNGEEYSVDATPELPANSLTGKTIYWLGSSVTFGFAACGEAVPDYMAKRNGLTSVKSTISGTTLAHVAYSDEVGSPWQVRVANGMPAEVCEQLAPLSYLARLEDFPKDGKPDLVVIQLSTNDSQFPAKYQGIIADGFDEADFDGATTFGATQLILARVKKYWGCPVLIYTSPLLFVDTYKSMVEATRTIADKWGAHLLDMNADEAFNELGQAHMEEWMNDPVHPKRRGYIEWWTPRFEEAIRELV